MKCPNCGYEIPDGQLYCENCGNEIRIVPDFDPEIENSISEAMTTLAEELAHPEGVNVFKPDIEEQQEKKPVHKQAKKVSSRFIFVITSILFALLIAIVCGILFYQHNSKDYQISKAMLYGENQEYDRALECLSAAAEIDGTDPKIYFLMADYYYASGREEEALAVLREIAFSETYEDEIIEKAYTRIITLYKGNENYQAINDLLLACENNNIIYQYQNYMAYPPEFSYIEGTYDEVVPLKLSANTTGAIYYTLDGTEPDLKSEIYKTPIFLETGTYTVTAFFVNDYGISSDIVSNSYTINLAAPVAPEVGVYSGEYNTPTKIEVSVPAKCKVYYTTDNSEPTDDSQLYTEPLSMPLGKSVFKFIAYSKEGVPGEVTVRNYQLSLNAPFNVNDGLESLSAALVAQGRILDYYGHLLDMPGRYIYKYISVNTVGSQGDFYFIYEYYEDETGGQSRTGEIFGVNVQTGACGKIIKGDDKAFYFEPFDQEQPSEEAVNQEN